MQLTNTHTHTATQLPSTQRTKYEWHGIVENISQFQSQPTNSTLGREL